MKQHPKDAAAGVDLHNLVVTDSGYDYGPATFTAHRAHKVYQWERCISTSRPLSSDEKAQLLQMVRQTAPDPKADVTMVVFAEKPCEYVFQAWLEEAVANDE